MTEMPPPDWRLQQIARAAAEEAVKAFAERLGIEDIGKTRRNLDYLDMIRDHAEGRLVESRKTIFTVLGGAVLLVLGYLASAFGFRGHVP